MEVIYGLIPGMIIMGLVAVAVFFWAARNGQFEDPEGEASRILMDDDLDDVEPAAAAEPVPADDPLVADRSESDRSAESADR